MTLLKKMMLAVSLLVASSFASAAVYDLDLTTGSNDTIVDVSSVGVFYDLFDFTLTEDSSLDQSLTVLTGTLQYLTFSIFEAGAGGAVVGAATAIDGVLKIDDLFLQAGGYTTSVFAVAAVAGEYSLATSISAVSPVPEASTLAMILGGLGLVGFMARRRKVA